MNKLPCGIVDFSFLPSGPRVTYPGYELDETLRNLIFSGLFPTIGWEGLA